VYYTNRYRHHPILAKTFIINALFRKSVEYRQPGYPTVVNLRFDAVLAGIPPRASESAEIPHFSAIFKVFRPLAR